MVAPPYATLVLAAVRDEATGAGTTCTVVLAETEAPAEFVTVKV
jgi:hypothetical protein